MIQVNVSVKTDSQIYRTYLWLPRGREGRNGSLGSVELHYYKGDG